MTALLVNGPRDGHTMEISEAVETILCRKTAMESLTLSEKGAPLNNKSSGVHEYRLVGVRGNLATYKFAR